MNIRNFFVGRAIGFIIVLIFAGILAGFYAFNNYIYQQKQGDGAKDYKNITYKIQGVPVALTDGVAETEAASGSATKVVTRYFGNELQSDITGDGREDIVFLLTQQTGGSGTFYYVVAAVATDTGYAGSDAVLLGDRIAPQTTEKGKGKIVVVNYADRAPSESFATPPSVGKSMWLLLDPATLQFGQVEQNFEGEADPTRMSLGMKTWEWVSALYNDEREIRPAKPVFTLTFKNDGNFFAATDCNSIGGTYTTTGSNISFLHMVSTKKYCADSQESEFTALLTNTQSYHFTSRGELILDLKFDSGSAVFR